MGTQDTIGSSDSANRAEVHSGLSVELAPASIRKRLLAYIVDLGIVYAFVYAVIIIFAILGNMMIFGLAAGLAFIGSESAATAMTEVMSVVLVVIQIVFAFAFYHGYFIYQEVRNGKTVGKKLLGLTVVTVSGERLTAWQCILRDMFRYVDVWMILPGIISMLLTEKKQRVGDLLAGTRIVSSRYQAEKHAFLYVTQDEYWRLFELLEPEAVPLDICNQYCGYASRKFIAQKGADEEQDRYWLSVASTYFKNKKLEDFETEKIMLFFAEVCLKNINK